MTRAGRLLVAATVAGGLALTAVVAYPDALARAREHGDAAPARGQAQATPQVVKGLAVTPTAVARGRIVSLRDCPPGANTQRGVIRPIEDSEFVTVSVSIKVLPAFVPVAIAKPVLVDAAGNTFNTGQAFADVAAEPSYACDFSFRVPAGTEAARLVIDGVTFDLTNIKR